MTLIEQILAGGHPSGPYHETTGEETMSQYNPFLTIDQKIVGDAYTSMEAMDNLVLLCDEFGSRFGGTEGERQAVEFLEAKMAEYGLTNVHREPVDYIGWVRGQATLEVISPVRRTIPCISLPHSPAATLDDALIVDIADGGPEDFADRADEIKGRVVLTTSVVAPKGSRRWIHRREKYSRSLLAWASGFIFANHYPGYGPATGGIGHRGAGLIPGVSISKEDGAFIRRLVGRAGQVRIRLTTTDACQPMTSWNVVGELRGQNRPDQIVMVGCHYDGHDISQGAEDPASGTVSVLEAARLLALYAPPLDCSLRFVLWGIEEFSLLGSRAYVAAHSDDLDRIRFYLNMDSAGAQRNSRDIVLHLWPDLEPLLAQWSEEMGLDFALAQRVHAASDHYPFFLKGVPTGGMESADLSLGGRGYGHTQYDTVDKVDVACIREASALAARLALRIASASDWPVARRDQAAVQELLDTPEHREEQTVRERVEALYAEVRPSKWGSGGPPRQYQSPERGEHGMTEAIDLNTFVERARELGALDAKLIATKSVVTAPWVRMKCHYGCGGYNRGLCCPPYTPTPQETQQIIDCYSRALLVHSVVHPTVTGIVSQLEREIFLAGYYKALAFGEGSCRLCRPNPCNLERCVHPREARPSMEACGIDVYATARSNGFPIQVVTDRSCPTNTYGLVLID